MDKTIIYTVLSISILYFLFAFSADFVKKLIGRKICAICAAVSLTWLSLLLLKLAGFKIDTLVIAILMGQSVVGLMVKLEEYFKRKSLRRFWMVRILIIAGGTFFVYWLLKEEYFLLLILLLTGVFTLPSILSLIYRGKSGSERLKGPKDYQKAVSKLEKMMEDCC